MVIRAPRCRRPCGTTRGALTRSMLYTPRGLLEDKPEAKDYVFY
jgi:hypothetical protein